MRDVPFTYKLHILAAFALFAFSPFSRLIHIWSLPCPIFQETTSFSGNGAQTCNERYNQRAANGCRRTDTRLLRHGDGNGDCLNILPAYGHKFCRSNPFPARYRVLFILWLLLLGRIIFYPRHFLIDLGEHSRGAGYFTTVAGTCILGTQFVILDHALTPALLLLFLATCFGSSLSTESLRCLP